MKGKDGKVVKVLTAEEVAGIGNRLSQRKKGDAKIVEARDFNDWKRKNCVKPNQKVFSMTGWYPCVKDDLLERGWFFNEDRDSPFFDLKWTLRSTDVKPGSFQPHQLTNHFLKNTAITTKVGLMKSLRNLTWFASDTEDSIFPRAYDLKHLGDLAAFMDDYRCLKAESLLKLILVRAHRCGLKVECEIDLGDRGDESESGSADTATTTFKVNERMLKCLVNVCEKRSYKLEDSVIDDPKKPHASMVSEIESELILNGDKWLWKPVELDCDGGFQTDVVPEQIDQFLKDQEKQLKEKELLVTTTSTSGGTRKDPPTASQLRAYESRVLRRKLEHRKAVGEELCKMQDIAQEDVDGIIDVLTKLQNTCDPLQKTLDGKISNNLWIVKPAGKSRGRGIATFQDLNKILDYTDAKTSGNGEQWVVQKYMENPLTIAKRKFDVRQWVLVTDWNPLTIWFYDDCYCRFAVSRYDNPQNSLDKLEGSLSACIATDGVVKDSWLDDQYVHLVNNSISSKNKKFHEGYSAENGVEVVDNMWPASTFQSWIIHQTGEDKWSSRILPRMKQIAKYAIMCAQDMVEHRKNSWELYGIDYMFDQNYEPWLIEINSSPACDYSTKVTENYVQSALPDILKVTLDHREWERARSEGKAKKKDEPDCGGWELIHKGSEIPTPLSAFGSDFGVTGSKIKIARGSRVKDGSDGVTSEGVAVGGFGGVRDMRDRRKKATHERAGRRRSSKGKGNSEEEEEEEEGEEDGDEGSSSSSSSSSCSSDEGEGEGEGGGEGDTERNIENAGGKGKGKDTGEIQNAVAAAKSSDLVFDDSDLSDYEEEEKRCKEDDTAALTAEKSEPGLKENEDGKRNGSPPSQNVLASELVGAAAAPVVVAGAKEEAEREKVQQVPETEKENSTEYSMENATENPMALLVDNGGRLIKGTKKSAASSISNAMGQKGGEDTAAASSGAKIKISTLTFDGLECGLR